MELIIVILLALLLSITFGVGGVIARKRNREAKTEIEKWQRRAIDMKDRLGEEITQRKTMQLDLDGWKQRASFLQDELTIAQSRLGTVIEQNKSLIEMIKGQTRPEMIIDRMGSAMQKVFMPAVPEDETEGVNGRMIAEDHEVFIPEHELERDPWLEEPEPEEVA